MDNTQPSEKSLAEAVRRLNDNPRAGFSYREYSPSAQELARALDEIDRLRQKPWCHTRGTTVDEVLCPKCTKWWNDNTPPITEETLLKEARGFNPEEYGCWLDVTEAALRRGIELAGGKIAEPVDPLAGRGIG